MLGLLCCDTISLIHKFCFGQLCSALLVDLSSVQFIFLITLAIVGSDL